MARSRWRIMLVRARRQRLPAVTSRGRATSRRCRPSADKALTSLTTQAAAALATSKSIVGARRFFSGGKKREAGTGAADYLRSYREWALTSGVPQLLERLAPRRTRVCGCSRVRCAVPTRSGLAAASQTWAASQELVAAARSWKRCPASITAIERALQREAELSSAAVDRR